MRTPPRTNDAGMRWLGLGASALVIQVLVVRVLGSRDVDTPTFAALLITAHLLLIPFLIQNLRFRGIRLILLGLSLNLGVMLANGGLMPVEAESVQEVGKQDPREMQEGSRIEGTKNALLERSDIRGRVLADVIVLPLPRPYKRAVSAGDVLVAAGGVVAYAEVLRRTLTTRGRPFSTSDSRANNKVSALAGDSFR